MPLAKYLELESDPGIFTKILNDLGINSLQVDEVYDLDPVMSDSETLGYIFLFKWTDDGDKLEKPTKYVKPTKSEKPTKCKNLPDFENKLIFLRQKASNSCASHALLNIMFNTGHYKESQVLKNIKNKLDGVLEDEANPLKLRKIASKRGRILAENATIQEIHNRYAGFYSEFEDEGLLDESSEDESETDVESGEDKSANEESANETSENEKSANEKSSGSSEYQEPRFHFTCYIPFENRVVELDGLKRASISHGEIRNNTNWTKSAKNLIKTRISDAHNKINSNERNSAQNTNDASMKNSAENSSENTPQSPTKNSFTHKNQHLPHDIRYSLLAVKRRAGTTEELKMKYQKLVESLSRLTAQLNQMLVGKRQVRQSSVSADIRRQIHFVENTYLKNKDKTLGVKFQGGGSVTIGVVFDEFKAAVAEIQKVQGYLADDTEKAERYHVDQERRSHDYFKFIERAFAELEAHDILPPFKTEPPGLLDSNNNNDLNNNNNCVTTDNNNTPLDSKIKS